MTHADQIAAIVAEITPVLSDRFDPKTYAAGMLEDNDDDDGHFEVRGLHTKSGAPHAFSIA